MADFDKAIHYVIYESEGGAVFENDPDDPGGKTHYGVTEMLLLEHQVRHQTDSTCPVKNVKIEHLDEHGAKHVYESEFWLPPQLTAVRDQLVATKILDIVVNVGRVEGGKIVQSAVNAATKINHNRGLALAPLVVDGIISTRTVTAINTLPPEDVLDSLCRRSAEFYARLTQSKVRKALMKAGASQEARDAAERAMKFVGWFARAAGRPKQV